MEEFPSNSKNKKSPPEVAAKVISGESTLRKEPMGKRFVKTFFGTDLKTLGRNLLHDVVVPGVRDAVKSTLHQGVDRSFGGSGYVGTQAIPTVASGIFGRVMTNYSQPQTIPGQVIPNQQNGLTNPELLVIPNRMDVERVMDGMFAYLNEYGRVTIADLCGMVGRSAEWTDRNWGWTTLSGMAPRQNPGGGYTLALPPPIALNK